MTDEKVIKSQQEFTIPLKNGNIVKLTKQDILQNNIQKLRDQIPDLKIADKLSDKNPFKKIMQTLESGVQNKQPYYKWLSIIILTYLWLIQGLAFYHNSPSAKAMLLISFWATYAIIRLQVKPYFNYNILLSLVKKLDVPFFLSSITFSLLILSIIYELLTPNKQCSIFKWGELGKIILFYNVNTITYYKFLVISCLCTAFLMALYNIYINFEKCQLDLLLSVETIGIKVFKFLSIIILLYFLPFLFSDKLCNIEDRILLWAFVPIFFNYIFYAFFENIFNSMFFITKNIMRKHYL